MKTRIEIETKTFVRFWLVVIGFLFAIYLIYLARTALIILGAATFLALALSGPVNRLRQYIPGKSRIGATAIAFLVVVSLLISVALLVIPPVSQQTGKFIEAVPSMVDSVSNQWDGVGSLVEKYQLQTEVDKAVENFKDNISSWLSNAGKNIISGVGSLFGVIGMVFLTLVLTFLILIEGPDLMRKIWGLYDDQETMESHRTLAMKIHRVVSGYVTGQLTVSSIGALCTGVAVFILSLFIASVPGNLAIPAAAISFVFSLIPMFGATVGGILITLLLLINSVPAGIIYAIYFVVYQQIENNFISPTIQSKYVELSPLMVLAAVTIGLYLFGLAGGIISIPIAGAIKVLLEQYLADMHKKRERSKRPLAKLLKKTTR